MNKKYQFTLLCAAVLSSSAQAAVIAQFNSFEHINSDNVWLSQDASAQSNWVTTDLQDHAEGEGALNSGNRTLSNRNVYTIETTNVIGFSHNREGDSGVPTGISGESTWMTFSITADAGLELDFAGQMASADTFVASIISDISSSDWTLYYSSDGANWISLGTRTGASAPSNSSGEASVSWDLSAIGSRNEVHFLLDPQATGETNGTVSQRRLAVGNIEINANVIPEPSSLALLGFVAAFGFRRRRA